MFNKKFAALAIALPALMLAANAQALDRVNIGAGVSTLGYGMDANVRLGEHFSSTVGFSRFSVDGDDETDGVRYDGKLTSENTSIKLNWHPFAGGFHVAAGAVIGDFNAAVTGTPRAGGSYELNGVTYAAADVGSLTGRVQIKDNAAPYFGIGFRSQRQGLGIYADLGVIAAKTSVELSATGLAADARFQADLQAERRELEDSIGLDLYPIIGAGLIYRF